MTKNDWNSTPRLATRMKQHNQHQCASRKRGSRKQNSDVPLTDQKENHVALRAQALASLKRVEFTRQPS